MSAPTIDIERCTTTDRILHPERYADEPWIPSPEELSEGPSSSDENPTLVIGDVHGHFDRLEALLKQEGILGECSSCDGLGQIPGVVLDVAPDGIQTWSECTSCEGDGQRRINHDVNVVQLGDLGHFGGSTGSPGGDVLCYQYAPRWLDLLLWGNHDRAVIDTYHIFSGFETPGMEVKHMMHGLYAMDKLRVAHAAHGFLITHAGLHAQWKQQPGVDVDKNDPYAVAEWLNDNDWWPNGDKPESPATPVIDAIGYRRGGPSPYGGILWRDRNEKLYDGFPQVFGHSADKDGLVRRFSHDAFDPTGKHWCIDIGGKMNARLAGIWLPSQKIVRIDL